MSNGLWSQLGATDIVQSCGAELAEVLTQVDLLIEKKRQEWDMDLRRAEETAKQAISREKDSNSRLEDQQRRYEETISSLRVDLGKLKEAYLKLEKHSSGRPDKYKRILHEKKSKLELTERQFSIIQWVSNLWASRVSKFFQKKAHKTYGISWTRISVFIY